MNIKLDCTGNSLLIIQLILCILKVCHIIKWSWYVTFIPLYLWGILTLIGIGLAIYISMKNKW